jgi:signal transduction histidine kinase
MSGSQMELEGGGLAAGRIAADPAFSALDSSGAPILAAFGEPLEVVYLNAAARAVFGADVDRLGARLFFSEDPGAKRLTQLVESVRHGAALRLERLRFALDEDAPQTITVLCRKLAGDDGPPCFVVAALGLRPATAREAETVSKPASPRETRPPADGAPTAPRETPPTTGQETPPTAGQEDPAAAMALRAALSERHGARAPRFLWKTDAAGRFIDVTQALADVVGEENADILGRSVEEVASSLVLDPAFARAIATRKSWSGIEVDWPLRAARARAPVTLGALPTMDADRRFAGFQGYGVLHLSRAFVSAPEAEPPPALPAPEMDEPDYPSGNVVSLRAAAAHRQELQERPSEAENDALSLAERMNFEEIARALRGGAITPPDAADARDEEKFLEDDAADDDAGDAALGASLNDIAARLNEFAESAPPRAPLSPEPAPARIGADILDCLPVGLLIARGAQTLFANRMLLDHLGYPDIGAFDADGGLARMFFGRSPADAGGRAAVQSSEGEALDVDVHLQTIEWDGAPATLVTLRQSRARPTEPSKENAAAAVRAAEEKLARARSDNSLLRAIVESSDVAVAVLDEEGRIESATGPFAALFDAKKGTFDGLPLTSLFVAEDARPLAARLARIATEAGETLRLTARVGRRIVDAQIRRLGPTQKLCVTLREPVAEQRNDELKAARDAAEQASAAKSDFLARISHEIRTPLNAIIGFAEVMMEERLGPIGSERYKEYLKDVHASGEHVLSLVNDLLDLSKIEAGKMELDFERVDANAVISECASIMQTQANQARIVMRLSLAPRLPPIRADERSLKQILLNLLSNAVKFNEPGGQVIVSSALTDSGYVVIRVKDTGIGMTEEELQTALEPFKQVATRRSVRGTGLGLPLTKALIEANQATFSIKSRKNEGTLTEVAFPPPQVLAAE